jgi:hypothetical protein
MPPGVVLFQLNGSAVGDKWKKILICLNGNGNVKLPPAEQKWQPYIINNRIVKGKIENGERDPYSFSLYYQE